MANCINKNGISDLSKTIKSLKIVNINGTIVLSAEDFYRLIEQVQLEGIQWLTEYNTGNGINAFDTDGVQSLLVDHIYTESMRAKLI